jgi:quinol monooxygenase YgiN
MAMVLYVMKWDIPPDKVEAYLNWTESAVPPTLAVPGVIDFQAHQPDNGTSQIVVTYEFDDLAAWADWYAHGDVRKAMDAINTLTNHASLELWIPSLPPADSQRLDIRS